MNEKIFESFSSSETEKLAFSLAQTAKPSQIYCLLGELGAGKTIFSKGFAKGLGIVEHITSPTFGIVNEYKGNKMLYHFDVYRINSYSEMDDTGYEEYFYSDGICLIEWANMIECLIPEYAIWINIHKDYEKNDTYRKIEVINLI